MGSQKTWSIGLGNWGGLHIRVHCLFLLFAAFTLFLGWQAQDRWHDALAIAGGSLCILLVSVFLHELGHYLAALRLGGGGSEVVLGPLGGLSTMRAPFEPQRETAMHLAGPAVNLGICLLTGAAASWFGQDVIPLLNPLVPGDLVEGGSTWLRACKLTFWINWVLLLANLLPAFPFDGGRALRSALLSLWPEKAGRGASSLVASIAKVTAVALVVMAAILMIQSSRNPPESAPVVPTWFALLLLAIFLYFSAKQESERHDDLEGRQEPFGYDFSQGYTSFERAQERVSEVDEVAKPTGPFQRWLAQRKQSRVERQRKVEQQEEAEVDNILSRLHSHGYESLSDRDRSVLARVSERYRSRGSK